MLLLIQDYLILVATMVEIITQQKHVIGKMVYRLTSSPIEEVKEVEVYGGLAPSGKCDLEWLTNTEGLGLCTLAA